RDRAGARPPAGHGLPARRRPVAPELRGAALAHRVRRLPRAGAPPPPAAPVAAPGRRPPAGPRLRQERDREPPRAAPRRPLQDRGRGRPQRVLGLVTGPP